MSYRPLCISAAHHTLSCWECQPAVQHTFVWFHARLYTLAFPLHQSLPVISLAQMKNLPRPCLPWGECFDQSGVYHPTKFTCSCIVAWKYCRKIPILPRYSTFAQGKMRICRSFNVSLLSVTQSTAIRLDDHIPHFLIKFHVPHVIDRASCSTHQYWTNTKQS